MALSVDQAVPHELLGQIATGIGASEANSVDLAED
jgi:hypothetical protein